MGLKDYKIVWFTEQSMNGKIPLDNPNMRNDVSTMYTLGVEHYPIFGIPQALQHFGEGYFDIGIVTLPKTNTEHLLKFDLIGDLKKLCKKPYQCKKAHIGCFKTILWNNRFGGTILLQNLICYLPII